MELAIARLERACTAAMRRVAFVGVVGMLGIAGLQVLDVLLRWTLDAPIPALNEVVSMVFAVAIVACVPSGLSQGVSLTVDILAHRVPTEIRGWLEAGGAVILFLFQVALCWQLGATAAHLAHDHRITVILGWPEAPFIYAVAVLFGVGAAVQAVVATGSVIRVWNAPAALRHRLVAIGAVLIAIVVLAVGANQFDVLSDFVQDNVALTLAIAFVVLWALLLLLVPLSPVMGFLGLIGSAFFIGFAPALDAFGSAVETFLTNSQVAVLPLFLMMGTFAAVAGLSEDIYALAHAVLGGFRGGLALATIGGCAGFGAVTGSSVATAATIGRVSLPEMRARGYSAEIASGCVAAGGTLGQLVPPSTAIVIYALLTEVSIGQLFVAAIIPALIAVVFYFLTITIFVRFVPGATPPAVRTEGGVVAKTLRRSAMVIVLFLLVIGGLYFGVFTATESASVGVVGAFLCALARGKLKAGAFWSVMAETTSTTAMIYGLIFGAVTFSFFVGVSGLPDQLTEWVAGLNISSLGVIALLLAIYTMLGAVMDSFAIMIITVPVVAPIILKMGYDLLWWGIIMVIVVETGMITPPFGLNVFVLKSVAPDIPLSTVFRGVLPFVCADLLKLILLVLIPSLILWLPSSMFH